MPTAAHERKPQYTTGKRVFVDSFFWYDLETSGTSPKWDRVTQFAGLRTDLALKETGEEYETYVQLPADVLPSPGAALVTGITPQRIHNEGISEWEAFRKILALFSRPGTCVAGYNSLRFDDEFTRYGLYRMLMDPYAREWQNGNSRWDLIDLGRAARALRPEGINWPTVDGRPVFKLEALAAENGIEHSAAHDAMSDVRATVGFARCIREHQPMLFDYYFKARAKRAPRELLEPIGRKLCVHVSGMYPHSQSNLAPVISLARHPLNNNSYLVADLSQNIEPLLNWGVDELREALFSSGGHQRPPLKEIRINRCPFLSGANVLRSQDLARLDLSIAKLTDRQEQLLKANVGKKIAQVYARQPSPAPADVDAALYEGFLGDADRAACEDFQSSLVNGVWPQSISFKDDRLRELSFRLKARCFPHLLTETEQHRWSEFVSEKLSSPNAAWLTLPKAREQLDEASLSSSDPVLGALDEHYGRLELELGQI